MSLAPSVKLILGNLLYESHVSEVMVELQALPGINRFRAMLPVGVQIEAAPGDAASLELDGGEGRQTVLTGKLRVLRRGLPATEAIASDAGADLAAFRPNVTYERQNGG
ncbi:MAG TPA: hypothetical protein VNJ09_08990, partial [Chthonomonadales bacterium]|nr:hypothetical protein [Chthonomonadales bacterium]